MGYYDNYLKHGMKGWAKKNHKYIRREQSAKGWKYYYAKAKEGIGVGLKDEISRNRYEEGDANFDKESANHIANYERERASEERADQKRYHNMADKAFRIAKSNKDLSDMFPKYKDRTARENPILEKQARDYAEKGNDANDWANMYTRNAQEEVAKGVTAAKKEANAKAQADAAQRKYDKSLLGKAEKTMNQTLEKVKSIKIKNLFN